MLSNTNHLVYIVISPLLSALFVGLNAISCYVFCRKLKLASLTVIQIFNICICDIFVSSVSNSWYVASLLHPRYNWQTGSLSCKLFKFLTMMVNESQIFSLALINLDMRRRIVMCQSFQWTKRFGILAQIVIWTASFLITLPQFFLFDERVVKTFDNFTNQSYIVSINCKPMSVRMTGYEADAIIQFIVGYALPAGTVLYTTASVQIFLMKKRSQMHTISNQNYFLRSNYKIHLTFAVTSATFLFVWTPFFVSSLIDLSNNMIGQNSLKDLNFILRCTLLLLGSTKPVFYIIFLDKFRYHFIQVFRKSVVDKSTKVTQQSIYEISECTRTLSDTK